MSKSPDAFRTISEVADWLDKPAHVLRFWESKFTQVKPVKRAGGRRYYRPEDIALLGGLKKLLHDDGMTIKGVQKILREQGVKYVASLSPDIDDIAPETGSVAGVAPAPPVAAPPQSAPVETVVAFQRADTPEAPPADITAAPPAPPAPPVAPDSAMAEGGMTDGSNAPVGAETPPVATEATSDTSEAPVLVEADLPEPPHKTEVFPPADDAPPPARDIPSFLRAAPAEPPMADTAPAEPEPVPAHEPELVQDTATDTGPASESPVPQDTAPDAADNIAEPTAIEPAAEPAAPAPPRPQVIDVADVPPVDQIDAAPGLLSLIAARKTPLSPSARGKLTDALSDLRRLRDRLGQQARD